MTLSGLVGHWTLDDPAGTTAAADTSGSGNAARCGGTVYIGTGGAFRNAVCPIFGQGAPCTDAAFNGAGEFLWINDDIGGTFSVSAWIETKATGTGAAGNPAFAGSGIVWADVSGTAPDMIPLALVGDRAAFGTGEQNGGSYDTLTSTVAVNTGSWVHLVVTRDMSTGVKQMFVNGALDGTSTGSTGMLNANPIIAFGGNPLDGRYFDGVLYDVQFYGRVLTPADVTALYADHP